MQINVEKNLSPERRKQDYWLAREMEKAINGLDVPKEEKDFWISECLGCIIEYEQIFHDYHKKPESALAIMN